MREVRGGCFEFKAQAVIRIFHIIRLEFSFSKVNNKIETFSLILISYLYEWGL